MLERKHIHVYCSVRVFQFDFQFILIGKLFEHIPTLPWHNEFLECMCKIPYHSRIYVKIEERMFDVIHLYEAWLIRKFISKYIACWLLRLIDPDIVNQICCQFYRGCSYIKLMTEKLWCSNRLNNWVTWLYLSILNRQNEKQMHFITFEEGVENIKIKCKKYAISYRETKRTTFALDGFRFCLVLLCLQSGLVW